MAEPRRSCPPATIRSIMWRWPMKLIRSMPGVPSATPAQENRASTGPPHSATAASIEALSDMSTLHRLHAVEGDLGPVHHDHLGAGVPDQLGGRRAHAGGAADDDRPLALVAEGVEQRHVCVLPCVPWARCENYDIHI